MKEDLRGWCKSRCCNDSGSMIRDGVALKKKPEMLAYYTDKGCEVKPLASYRI